MPSRGFGAESPAAVVIADDHEIFVDGLRALLEREPDLSVVGRANEGREAVEAASRLQPDLILIDVTMPGMNGVEATRRIAEESPGVKVLCLSMHAETGFIEGALEAGASGYLLKDSGRDELLRAIRSVLDGNVYLTPGVGYAVVNALKARSAASGEVSAPALTSREREIVQLVAEGRAAKDIAGRLHISAKTVNTHRENVMRKLGIRTVAGLTKYAIRNGLTSSAMDPE